MVSIIIPTFNRARTIERSINSLLNQTYQDFEIIVVDDCSNDDTKEVIDEIKDDRIIYIRHEKNLGANAARNTGVMNAKGNIIAFQDSDDEWLENKLEIQMNEMNRTKADIVSCAINKYVGKQKTIVPEFEVEDNKISKEILYGNFISGQTILGKKKCFIDHEFDKLLPRLQEWELMIRLSQIYNIHFVNQPLVNVYLQNDSISTSPEKAVMALKIIKDKHKDLIFNDNKAIKTIYNMLGNYSMQARIFEENYYSKAIKYDKTNLKLYIKSGLYYLKKFLNKN